MILFVRSSTDSTSEQINNLFSMFTELLAEWFRRWASEIVSLIVEILAIDRDSVELN